jgi:hypothetical protein
MMMDPPGAIISHGERQPTYLAHLERVRRINDQSAHCEAREETADAMDAARRPLTTGGVREHVINDDLGAESRSDHDDHQRILTSNAAAQAVVRLRPP